MTDYDRAVESRVWQVEGQADNSHNKFHKNATKEHNSNVALLIIQSVHCTNRRPIELTEEGCSEGMTNLWRLVKSPV